MVNINTQEALKEIVTIIKGLVSYRSTTDNKPEVRKCTDYITSYFRNTKVIVEELEHNGVLSLYLRLPNSHQSNSSPYNSKLLLSGHYDVVAGDDDQFQAEEKEDKQFGRGAIDMKAGVATAMYLMKRYSEASPTPSLAVLLTSDEEIGGTNGAGFWLEEKNITADF